MDYQLGRHIEVIICSVHCATFMRWYEAAHKLIFVGWCVCVCLCTGECVNLKTTAVCFKTPERGVLQSSVFIHFSSFLALKTIITSPLPASPRVWLLQSLLLMGKSMQCLAYGMWIEGLSFLGEKKEKKHASSWAFLRLSLCLRWSWLLLALSARQTFVPSCSS